MRVSLIDAQNDFILVDGASIDNNEGWVKLEFTNIEPNHKYKIKYEFSSKQISDGSDISEVQYSGTQTMCKFPFVTQELLIQDKRVVRFRIAKYKNQRNTDSLPLDQLECDFKRFKNGEGAQFGEDAIFCARKLYTYDLSLRYNKAFYRDFEVRGGENSPLTYWFQLVIGHNFLISSGLKVMLVRTDIEIEGLTPLECFYDKSCVEATMSAKNELKIDVFVTTGTYRLIIFDDQSQEFSDFLRDSNGLESAPFTLRLSAYPVMQNEERANCPYMFLQRNFIQRKFIDGMSGQRFTFSDKIVLNVFNLTQSVDIYPATDSLLKVLIKESFGVNAKIRVCTKEDCHMESTQVGTSEMLIYQVKKGTQYRIEFGYQNSIISLASFFTCPHINFELSMIPQNEVQALVESQQCSRTQEQESEELLTKMFNELGSQNSLFQDYTKIFHFNVDQSGNFERKQNYEVVNRNFQINEKSMFFFEIFYEPYLYDLEVYLEDTEAGLVRSHINQATPNVDWSKYKGSKSIFVELEPSMYNLKIIQKIPAINENLLQFQPRCVQFQIRLIKDTTITKQFTIPNSLNYFGMIGPKGQNFGQVIYFCKDCVLENQQLYFIEFTLDETIDKQKVNFDSVIDSGSSRISLKLQPITPSMLSINEDKSEFLKKVNSTEKRSNKTKTTKGAEQQDFISKDSLSNTRYRVLIRNLDYSKKQTVTFSLRIDIQEKVFRPKENAQDILPKSIDNIQRNKIKPEGLKESEFILGTKYMVEWMNEANLKPFIPKSQTTYQAKYSSTKKEEDRFQLALPFSVTDEEAQVYGSVYEYTGVANLGMAIIKDVDEESDYFEVLSVPAKYHNYLYPTTLTKGNYFLVIEPSTQFPYEEDSLIRFGIDFVFVKETISDPSQEFALESVEVCDLPTYPADLNSPQFIHPLSGQMVQFFQDYSINQLQYDDSIDFTLSESSQVNVYVEVPKEITAYIELVKKKGTFKSKASTETLNEKNDIFLKQKDLSKVGVIQVREFLAAGSYELRIKGLEESEVYNAMVIRCQSFTLGITISPIANAKFELAQQCKSTQTLMSQIDFDKVKEGQLSYPLGENIVDTTYFKTDSQGEGPFLFYFQIAYNELQEGSISLTLNKYDSDTMLFQQAHIYQIQDSTTWVMAIIDEGTYVLSIQSLTSTKNKFGLRGITRSLSTEGKILSYSPCTAIKYSYFITSLTQGDSQLVQLSLMDIISMAFSGSFDSLMPSASTQQKEIKGDVKDINSAKCEYQDIPKKIAVQKVGLDESFTFKISKKQFEIIDILIDTTQLFKIHMYIENPKQNINAFLYQDHTMKNLLGYTESSKREKKLSLVLQPAKKAYKLKIVYDSYDEKDECPTYDFRIAMKPLDFLQEENLKCTGLKSPVSSIQVGNEQYYLTEQYAISSDLVEKYDKTKGVKYDIEVKIPHSNFFFDITVGYDFLTTEISAQLYAWNSKNELYPLGTTALVTEENLQEGDQQDEKTSFISKKQVRNLQINNIAEILDSAFSNDNRYLLRIKFDKQMAQLQNFLGEKNLYKKGQNILCYPFDLTILANPLKTQDTEAATEDLNELISVTWVYDPYSYLDARDRIVLYVQFKDSVKEDYKLLKFTNFISLVNMYDTQGPHKFPSSVRLSKKDESMLLAIYNHDTLDIGTCYNIVVNYDVLKVSNQIHTNILCTSRCVCYQKGMQSCNEEDGTCICHQPFTGDDCSSCMEGYVFDEKTGVCVEQRRCVASGGQENCNGHGRCYDDPKTGQAICKCDSGFADDGFDYCAKCKDPLFSFPNCGVRNWIIESSEVNCQNIPTKMPSYLFNSKNKTVDNETIYFQNDEGLLTWAGTYRLFPDKKTTRSYHQFMVKQNSVLRFFFDTLKSKVKVKYQFLDNEKKIFQQTDVNHGYEESDAVYEIINQPSTKKGQRIKPFTLVLDYEFDKNIDEEDCPVIQIYMILEPWNIIQEHLKCTSDEIEASKEGKQFAWELGYQSKMVSEKFVLRSDQTPNDSQMVYTKENNHFYTITYNLKITESGNALSIFASYSFKEAILGMSLVDTKTNNYLSVESLGSMQDLSLEMNEVTMDKDMLTYIEVPSIEAGIYELQILVVKGLFLPTKRFKTCLSFDFVIEYIAIAPAKQEDNTYTIQSVFPATSTRLRKRKGMKIEVKFNKNIEIDDLVEGESGIEEICYLEEQGKAGDQARIIYPYKNLNKPANAFQLYFDFSSITMGDDLTCFSIKCSTAQSKKTELFKTSSIDTKYCFQKREQQQLEIECNPWALPKIQNNKCVCSPPYTGDKCEDCLPGYIKSKDQQTGQHTICSLDMSKCSNEICNNHGTCLTAPESAKEDQYICKCDDKYDGQFCEFCKDRKLAYPDCEEILVDIYNMAKEQKYQDKRQYNVDGYESSAVTKETLTSPKTQCSWANYPEDLDIIEYMDMLGGPFHISDYYNIHHDQDNIIKFTPRSQGVFKFLAQQPQLNELVVNDEIFDIEAGIYDVHNNKFLASSMNQILLVDEKEFNGKLEYTLLQFNVPFEYVNQTLYLMFRAVNYTLTSNEEMNSCTQVYLELEFKEGIRECQYGKMPQSTSNIVTVSESNPFERLDKNDIYSVYNMQKQFFYYQDFYLQDDTFQSDADQSYQVFISIQQKFIEKNQIDFALEILQTDVEFDSIEKATHKDKPLCRDICLVSGQKAYNEFRNQFDLSSKTYFRLWYFQSELDGSCANFQQFVTIRPKVQDQGSMLQLLQCEEQDLPTTLNTNKFLGTGKQKSFHYLQRYRVDNLKQASVHRIRFELNEPTMIRVVAPVHKHIEFDLELRSAGNKARRLITSAAKDFEDSIFAQLDSGEYMIKLLFVSEEFYLRQPCQSIELEIAMMPLSEVDTLNKQMASQGNFNKDFTIDQVLSSRHNHLYVQMIDTIKVYDIAKVSRKEQTYESYVTLHRSTHYLPQIKFLGAMLITQSDFLFNDVTFVLTNLDTKQIYKHSRREGLIKLVLSDLIEGNYELLIYSHNCLTNLQSGFLDNLTVKFLFDFNLVQWLDDESDAVHSVQLTDNKKKLIADVDYVERDSFACYQDYDVIPEYLNQHIVGRCDISGRYLLPNVQSYTHVMNFTANDLNDVIRILLIRPKTTVAIYEEKIEGEPLAKSKTDYGGRRQTLLFSNMKVNKRYFIQFNFTNIATNEGFEEDLCSDFYMHIKTFNSKKDNGCSSQPLYDDFKDPIYVRGQDQTQDFTINMMRNSKAIPFVIQDESVDFEITFEYSDQLYHYSVYLSRFDFASGGKDINSTTVTNVAPNELNLIDKNQVMARFKNIKKDKYNILIYQQRPKDCQAKVKFSIRSYPSLDQKTMLEQATYGSLKIYQSQQEIMDQNRFVSSLPITMDTFKFLRDENYLFISEYISLHSDVEQNMITFTVQQDKSHMRFYLESTEINMSLNKKGESQPIASWKTNMIQETLDKGEYSIKLEFYTDFAKKKALQTDFKIHYTFLLVGDDIQEARYNKVQGSALFDCDGSTNFPLALKRNPDKQISDIEATYEYPNLRLSKDTLTNKFLIDQFSFRVNETSRYHIKVGMHMVNHQITLSLTDLRSTGTSYIGKQQFNTHYIDMIVPPGDYSLTIDQPTMFDTESPDYCGIFSFLTQITPLTLMNSGNGMITQARCEVKEAVPLKIHGSEADTKGGYEFFVNSKGTFYRMFNNVLFRKSKESSILPEYDRIQLTVIEEGTLTLMFQYPSKSNSIIVKLYDAFGWAFAEPIVHKFDETEGELTEEHFMFSLQKNHDYVIMIYYEGQINTNLDGKEQCEYYNLAIGVNYLSNLKEDLKCLNVDKQFKSLKDLPKQITDKDLDKNNSYSIQDYFVLNYPSDFKALAINDYPEDKDLIVQAINIQLNDKFSIDSFVQFDYPLSLFHLSLLTDDAQMQSPLGNNGGNLYDPSFVRRFKQRNLQAQTSFPLGIYENMAQNYLEYVQKADPNQNLCVYIYFELNIQKRMPIQKSVAPPPLVTSVSPVVERKPMVIQKSKRELKVGLEFSETPYVKRQQQNGELAVVKKSDFMKIASLNFYDYSGKAVLFSKKPSLIQKDKDQQSWTFIFNVQEEQKNKDYTGVVKFSLDLTQLVNQQNKQFALTSGMRLPVFKLESIYEKPEQRKQAEETKPTIQEEIKKNVTSSSANEATKMKRTKTEVKCACVHGQCNPGEMYCNKCESGWEGKLCDIEIKATNINSDKDSPIAVKSGRLTRNRQSSSQSTGSSSGGDFQSRGSQDRPNYDDSPGFWGSYQDQSSFDFGTQTFTELPEKISNFSFSKVLEFLGNLQLFNFNLYRVVIVIMILLVAGGFYYFFNSSSLGGRLKNYIPVALNDNDEENQRKRNQMELTEFRPKAKKSKKKKQKAHLKDDDDEEETKRLSSELMLYANEQDEAEMLQHKSDEKPRQRHSAQPQSVNEQETSHEIEAALQQMTYDDDEEDESTELRQYF